MSNYYVLKNSALFAPLDEKDIGKNGNNFGNVYLSGNIFVDNQILINSSDIIPRILTLEYPDRATAANISGGETITIKGTGFKSNASVKIDNQIVVSPTVVNSTEINFAAPAKPAGNYLVVVENTDGGVGCYVPGIDYSQTPSWVTPSGNRATVYETQNIDTTLQVVERDIPNLFEIESGVLPSGVTLENGTGRISGTAPIVTNSNVYAITASVKDYQNQKAIRNFSLTVNPAPVIWDSPGDGSTYSGEIGQAFNLTLSASNALSSPIDYSANILPSGLSLNNNIISGTFTTAQTRSVLLTASAPAVLKSSTRNISFTVLPPMALSSGNLYKTGIRNYTDMPVVTRNSNLWIVPSAIGAQVGDLIFIGYYAGFTNSGEPQLTFNDLGTFKLPSNITSVGIAQVTQYLILGSMDPIEILRTEYPSNQVAIMRIYRPNRPIGYISLEQFNLNTYPDFNARGSGINNDNETFYSGRSLSQFLDSTGYTNYAKFHIASAICEAEILPQLQTSVPGFQFAERNPISFSGYWPTANWPLTTLPPAGSYGYVSSRTLSGVPSGQLAISYIPKGTSGYVQEVKSGRNTRSWSLEYGQMSALMIVA